MMSEQRKATLDLVKNFIKICDDNKIWYSIDGQTMVGALRHGGFVPGHERFEVMIKVSGYGKLQRLFPNNVIDSFFDKTYKSFTLAFINNNKFGKEEQPFIRIRILVPTMVKNFKKFTSIRSRIYRIITLRRDNVKRAIDELYEPRSYQGYHLLTKRRPSNKDYWIQALSKERIDIDFLNIKVKMIKEAPKIIDKWFGYSSLTTPQVVPKYGYTYLGPLNTRKEK